MNSEHAPHYKNGALVIQVRVDDLVSRMTLEEKISQMTFDAPVIERLDVPPYNWWNECLHGVGRAGIATVFPQAIGLAATWNPELIHAVATVISDEARAKHHEAVRRDLRQIYAGLTFWSPNVNLVRDPRWGRGQETYGEDPYLTAALGVAFVKGLQGGDPTYLKLVATPKHFAVHSGPEADRHRFDAQVDERRMRDFYLFAFEACIKEAEAASVMGAYNRVNGEPACASSMLLERILRDEWGFAGYVVSDCGAIRDIFAHHQVVETAPEAAALAVARGCDLNCGAVYPALLSAVAQGLISEEEIDRAVTRLMAARVRLGMFDPPEEVPYARIPYPRVDAPAHRALALKAARQSIVLLKNEGGLLPLSKDLDTIAVIGPNADSLPALTGNYNGTPIAPVTPLDGIRAKVGPGTRVIAAPGCEIAPGVPPLSVIPSAYLRSAAAETAESGLRAAYYDNVDFEGPPALERVDATVDFVWADSSPVSGAWGERFSARWEGALVPPVSGTYRLGVNGYSGYRLYLDGEELAASRLIHHPVLSTHDVTLEAGRRYRIKLELVNEGLDPQVQLLWGRPDAAYEASALAAAEAADVVVMAMGLSPELEAEEKAVELEGFSGGDRTDLRLPSPQRALLRRIHALGKPLVLVLLNGSALAVNWAAAHVPAIVEAWYPGQAGGDAIADVLFGDYNPAGRLPVTVYRSVDDLPPFDDYGLEGHTYRYFRGEPLYAFGHGLSYTTFAFDNLRLAAQTVAVGEPLAVRADVTNTGPRAGDEVVQLYVHRPDAPAPTPIKALQGFRRVSLAPGETKTVTFHLHTQQLGAHNADGDYVVAPGRVRVWVGGASDRLPLAGEFEITGPARSVEKVFCSRVTVF